MQPRSNNLTFVFSIILVCSCVPLAILSTYGYIKYPKEEENSCDFNLGGTCYTCDNKDGYCGYAYNYILDSNYYLNYYKGTNKYTTSLSDYVFIMDSATKFDANDATKYPGVYIYNKASGSKIPAALKGINDYGIGLDGSYYIVINADNKYGLYRIDTIAVPVIEYSFDFIGVANHLTDNERLDASILVVLDNGLWKLWSSLENTALTINGFSNPIYDFTNNVVVLYSNNNYYLYSYDGIQQLNINGYLRAKVFKEMIILVDSNYNMSLYNTETLTITPITVIDSLDNIVYKENTTEGYIDIYNISEPIKRVNANGTITDIVEDNVE